MADNRNGSDEEAETTSAGAPIDRRRWITQAMTVAGATAAAGALPTVAAAAQAATRAAAMAPRAVTPEAAIVDTARRMSAALVAFARTGNPAHAGIPESASFTAAGRATLIFENGQVLAKNDPDREARTLLLSS